jgi:hypothetical protein
MGRSQWTPGLGPARFLQRRCNQKSCRCALRSGVDRCTSPRAPRAGNSAARVRCVPHHVSRAARKRFSRAERGLSRRGLRRHPASARSLGGGLCGRSRCVRGPIQAPDDPPRPQDRRFSLGRACIAAFTATATAYHRHTHRTAPIAPDPTPAAPHRTAPHRTAPHRTAPHRTAPHRTAPQSVCLSVCLSVSLSLCLSVCLSVSLSVCLSLFRCLSVCLSV